MRIVVVEKPEPFVTLDEAKKHLHVEGNDDDSVITGLIAAACQDIDGPLTWFRRAIGVQVIEVFLDAFGHCPLRLPGGAVLEVIEVGYVDGAGAAQIVPGDVYDLRGSEIGSAWGMSWPSARYARRSAD